MEKPKKVFQIEFMRFLVIGGIGFIIDYSCMFILTEFMQINYLLSSMISFSFSATLNYIFCSRWVFKAKKENVKSAAVFFLVSIIGLALNTFIINILVEKYNIYYMISKIISSIIVVIWNYTIKKKVIMLYNKDTKQ